MNKKMLVILLGLLSVFLFSCKMDGDNKNIGTEKASTPSFLPVPGEYDNAQKIFIRGGKPGQTIYYTLDGSTPTTASTEYTEAFTIDGPATIKAIITGDGYESSDVGEGSYTFACAEPVMLPEGADLTAIQVLEFNADTEGASIYYTTDGSDPTSESNLYTGGVLISSTQTVKAIAVKEGYEESSLISRTYEIPENVFDQSYNLSAGDIVQSSEGGDKLSSAGSIGFSDYESFTSDNVVFIQPELGKQVIDGFGGSFTESTAYVLSYLTPENRAAVMDAYFGEDGANYSLTRTHIGSSDFTVEGRYDYAPAGDSDLADFSIVEDTKGFADTVKPDLAGYDGLYDDISPVDTTYDLIPLIHEALAIDPDIRIISSPWTAPPWMKNNNDEFDGHLLHEHYSTFADYFSLYLSAYEAEGINIWGITPVNEPHGNGGNWESMRFHPGEEADFIANYLGPTLTADGFSDVKILGFDQNRGGLEDFAHAILGNEDSAQYTYGMAVHWYGSSYKTFDEELDRTHAEFPDFAILHSEGCIDSLGDDEELYSWWLEDEWWWNENATEWGYHYAADKSNHPVYTPTHRYARNIIEGLNHWLTGWVDWNMVLDKRGGPNHVGNFCGAPIMIDPTNGEVYYTPIYYVMSHFSKYIQPGDQVISTTTYTPGLDSDVLHATAVQNANGDITVALLNTSKSELQYDIVIGSQITTVTIAANAVQTIVIN